MCSRIKLFLRAAPICFCLLLKLSGIVLGHGHGSGVLTVIVKEGGDAILPCSLSTEENVTQKLFDWKKDGQKEVFMYDAGRHYNNGRSGQDKQFKGRVSHFPEQLKVGNASITIRDTKVTDSGTYSCDFPRLQPRQIFYINLVVERVFKDRSCEITGAAPAPYVRILNATEVGVFLQCEVRGASLRPEVQWRDSDGKELPAEAPQVTQRAEHYSVSLIASVTKTLTNRFHCVVTQVEISHVVEAEITVPEQLFVHESCQQSSQFILGFCVGAVAVVLPIALYLLVKCFRNRRKKERRGSVNSVSTRASVVSSEYSAN